MNQSKLILTSIFLFSTFCVSASNSKITNQANAASLNNWSEREIRLLENLSLYNFTPKKDKTNQYVNDPNAVKFGKKLFFEKRFSANATVSCASCHKPDQYFTDGLAQAVGLSLTKRNTPTIVGASNNTWFFLDGRIDSLWAQATGPLENSKEHGSNRNKIAHIIFSDANLKQEYENVFGPMPDISNKKLFPLNAGPIKNKQLIKAWKGMNKINQDAITNIFVNIGKAIAAYETLLQPAPSRFDNYVKTIRKGDPDIINKQSYLNKSEIAGLKIFINKGKCFICHNGPLFTDQGFHNIGTPPLNVKEYDFGRSKAVRRVKKHKFNCLSDYNDSTDKSCDELKYMVFHDEDTLAAFKTPGLRNVTKTAPYMHGGQYRTLLDVIKHYNDPPATKIGMNKLLNIDLSDQEMAQLESFLKTLDSPINADPALLKNVITN